MAIDKFKVNRRAIPKGPFKRAPADPACLLIKRKPNYLVLYSGQGDVCYLDCFFNGDLARKGW